MESLLSLALALAVVIEGNFKVQMTRKRTISFTLKRLPYAALNETETVIALGFISTKIQEASDSRCEKSSHPIVFFKKQ